MTMLAVINKTDACVDYERTDITEQITQITRDKDIVTTMTFTPDNMYKLIYDMLLEDNEYPKMTVLNLYETKYDMYVAYFVDKFDLGQDTKTKINTFASQLVSHAVTGKMVIIKMQLSYAVENNNVACSTSPVTLSLN